MCGWMGGTLSGQKPINVLLRDIICMRDDDYLLYKKEQQNIYCWFLASCNILLTNDTDNF